MGFNSLFVCGKKFNLFSVVFSFFIIYLLIGIYNVQSLNYYNVDFYSGGGSSGIVPTLKSDDLSLSDYSNDFSGYATMTGISYSATVSFYSPHPNQIAYSTIDFSDNQTCFPFGTVNANNPEMKVGIDDDADSSTVYIHSNINVNPSVSDITFIGNTDEVDSSNRSYLYYQVSSNTEVGGALSQNMIDNRANLTRNNFANSWGLCNITTTSTGRSSMYAGWQTGTNRHIFDNRFFVFNSTGLGSINYTFLIHSMDSGCISESTNYYRSGYFKLENNPTFTTFGTNNNYSGVLSGLEPETLYVIQLGNGYVAHWGASTVYCYVYGSKVNSTYDFHIVIPEWDCSDYGECVDGTRFRTCIDLTGENPNKIEYEFCYVAPEESIYLGFDDITTQYVWYNYWGFWCSCSSDIKQINYPLDWTVSLNYPLLVLDENNKTGYNFDFLKMTSEESYEGDKSLKMWNIPPQLRIPSVDGYIGNGSGFSIYQNVSCSNLTSGISPDIYRLISTNNTSSLFVERNITLPTPYMSVSFKVKKCLEPELKFYATPVCLDFEDHCYTTDEDCNIEPKGTITFYLKDSSGDFLHDIKSVVKYPNKWEIREYAIDSLQPNTNYTIGFAVIPESSVDPNYYCVYLDDVNVDIRSQALVCESECDDNNEIRRYCKEYDETGIFCLVCEEISVSNSPNCHSSQTVIDKITSCENYCGCEELSVNDENYYTYYTTEFIEDCNITLHGIENCCSEYELILDSDYCIEYCDTQQVKDTISDDLQDELERRGLGFLGNFFTAMFIIMIIIVAIALVIARFLDKSWQGFVVVLIVEFLIVSVLWVDFSFIGIIIVVVLALFLAKMHSSTSSNTGG